MDPDSYLQHTRFYEFVRGVQDVCAASRANNNSSQDCTAAYGLFVAKVLRLTLGIYTRNFTSKQANTFRARSVQMSSVAATMISPTRRPNARRSRCSTKVTCHSSKTLALEQSSSQHGEIESFRIGGSCPAAKQSANGLAWWSVRLLRVIVLQSNTQSDPALQGKQIGRAHV